jgi:hypothetical protein
MTARTKTHDAIRAEWWIVLVVFLSALSPKQLFAPKNCV